MEMTNAMRTEETSDKPNVTSWQPDELPPTEPHPQAEEIVRQVDYYFGDENLVRDAHLLGLIREGNGTVSLNEVLSWKKMRQYKPRAAVKAAIAGSQVVEVVDGKRLARREPLLKPVLVVPRVNRRTPGPTKTELQHVGLTKGMLKSTGFEEFVTDGPLAPEEFARERDDYSSDNAITHRLETAVARYCSRRKMHAKTRHIFTSFLLYGGFETNQRQFTGIAGDAKLEDELSKKELQELTHYYNISEAAFEGLNDNGDATWVIDFEGVAKGFFSSELIAGFDWKDAEVLQHACAVIQNFYNYLLYHGVCDEFTEQIMAARVLCDDALRELALLKQVDSSLGGQFNAACARLFSETDDVNGWGEDQEETSEWSSAPGNAQLRRVDAQVIFKSAMLAHGTEEQQRAAHNLSSGSSPTVVDEQYMGIEVVRLESEQQYATCEATPGTFLIPQRKLVCKRWAMPHSPPTDLPQDHSSQSKLLALSEYVVLVDSDTAGAFTAGVKIEGTLKMLDCGVVWLDTTHAVFPSFYTWLPNATIRQYKQPGPPTEIMLQKNRMGG